MKYNVIVSRVCYQQQGFEVEGKNLDSSKVKAEEMAVEFDWSNNPTVDSYLEIIDIRSIEEEDTPERQVTIILGDMSFEDDTCLVINEYLRITAPIDKADEIAEALISEGVYDSYVIPELYSGTIL